MKKNYTLALAIFFSFNVWGQSFKNTNSNGFIENKGQIIDQNAKLNSSVKFLLSGKGMNVQLKNNGFSYDTYKVEKQVSKSSCVLEDKDHGAIYSFHRIDIDLINSNPAPEILVSEPSTDHFNYYTTGTAEQGITNVRSYGKILYKDIYPNIDLEFLSYNKNSGAGFKYNFVVRPGGNVADIKICYKGGSSLNLINNQIKIGTMQGPLLEKIPASYIQSSGKTLSVAYSQTENNYFSFNVSNYDLKETIVIDPVPNLVWATFYGGSSVESASGNGGIGKDGNGNVYISSDTQSPNNIATTGAYQTTMGGVQDVFLVKFNSSGVRQWGTYYGGSQDEYQYGSGLCVDQSNMIYICGKTSSGANIATVGAYDVTYNGSANIFIAKFDASGIRQWGTYFGNNQELGSSIVTDGTNYLYVCGRESGLSGLATPGTFMQTNANGGMVIAKLNLNGTALSWCTYYPGDQKMYLAYDPLGFLYVFGSTSGSPNVASIGAHQTTHGGGTWDYFLGKLDASNGTRFWGTYYGGAADDGDSFEGGVTFDALGNIYIAGSTASTTNISTIGSFQPVYGGGSYDGFIACFNSTGVRQWGTYYGGTGSDRVYSMNKDAAGMLCLSGSASSTTGISTPNSYQPNYIGGDAFISKFDQSGNRIWGTYYGHAGYGIGLVGDAGALYTVMRGGNASTYTTPGAHQTTPGGSADLFLVKLDSTCTTTAQPGIISGPATACSSTTYTYSISPVSGATSYTWILPGGWSGTSTTNSILTTTNSTSGTISVTANNACGSSTAQTLAVTVCSGTVMMSTTDVLCSSDCNGTASVNLSGGNCSPYTYLWSPGNQTSQNISNLCAGSYTVQITSSAGCTAFGTAIINQPTVLSAGTNSTFTTCGTCCDGTASVNATGGTPGYTYLWSPGGQTTANISAQCNGTYTVCVTDANGCSTCQTVNVFFNVGIDQNKIENGISVYPNPFNEKIIVQLDQLSGNTKAEIFNLLGEKIFISDLTSQISDLDMSKIESGIYFMKITTSDGSVTKKIVKE